MNDNIHARTMAELYNCGCNLTCMLCGIAFGETRITENRVYSCGNTPQHCFHEVCLMPHLIKNGNYNDA